MPVTHACTAAPEPALLKSVEQVVFSPSEEVISVPLETALNLAAQQVTLMPVTQACIAPALVERDEHECLSNRVCLFQLVRFWLFQSDQSVQFLPNDSHLALLFNLLAVWLAKILSVRPEVNAF